MDFSTAVAKPHLSTHFGFGGKTEKQVGEQ